MITLGEIKSINSNTNLCVVKLPTLEGVGNKNKTELHATMMLPPGIDAGYEEGDVVFVSFVDNTLGRPMVLGQLYRGPGKGTKIDKIGNLNDNSLGCAKTVTCNDLTVRNTAKCNNLEVSGATKIPQSTQFTGAEDNYDTPSELISRIKSLEQKVNSLESALGRAQEALTTLAVASAGGFLCNSAFGRAAASAACLGIGAKLGLGALVAEAFSDEDPNAEPSQGEPATE